MSQKRYNNINALRAISVIGIAFMHYRFILQDKSELGYLSSTIIPWFTQFVILFFIISCFGMCCGYYDKLKNHQISPNEFYSKRYKRILPFFTLLVIIDVAMSFTSDTLAQAFMDITLVFNLLPHPDIKVIRVGWFLGLIFLFYLLFPFFVFLLDNKRRAWFVFVISLIINFLCQTYFFTDEFINFNPGRQNILYSAPFLIAGGLCYLYRDKIHLFVIKLGNIGGLIICLLINAVYFIVPQSVYTLYSVVPLLVVFVVWLMYALGNDHKWMQNTVMNFLSDISMEIYLCHMLMYRAVERLHLHNYIRNNDLLYFVTCILGIGLAIVFSYYVKKYLRVFVSVIQKGLDKSVI